MSENQEQPKIAEGSRDQAGAEGTVNPRERTVPGRANDGTPSVHTAEITATTCWRPASGESLCKTCHHDSLTSGMTVYHWLSEIRSFGSDMRTRARGAEPATDRLKWRQPSW